MSILRHSEQLGNFGISLHSRIVESLVTQIEDAIEMGLIRCSQPTQHRPQLFSVYDFIRVILRITGERKAWKRLAESDNTLVAFCHYVSFDTKAGYKAQPSPATDLTGFIYMAYMTNCNFSYKLRASSAAYFAADRRPVVAPVQVEPQVAADVVADPDNMTFNRTLTELYEISGIKSRYYLAAAVKRDFDLGIDYVEDGDGLLLTEDAFNWLVASLRSARGTDTTRLPESIPLTRRGFRLAVDRKNARIGCALASPTEADPTEARPQVMRSHNVKPVSLANLQPNQPMYGADIKTKPIRVPVELVDKIRAFIADSL